MLFLLGVVNGLEAVDKTESDAVFEGRCITLVDQLGFDLPAILRKAVEWGWGRRANVELHR